MATFVGLVQWLKSLRALNAQRATIERHAEMLARQAGTIDWLTAASEALGASSTRVQEAIGARAQQLQELTEAIDALRARVELESAQARNVRTETHDLAERYERLRLRVAEALPAFPAMRGLAGEDAEPWFHAMIEGNFRGPTNEIAERLRVYVPYVQGVAADISALPAVDLGCGRGEWLGLMRQAGRSAVGVDVNPVSVDRCIAAGFDAVRANAIDYLRSRDDASASVISAFHVVEHLPVEAVMTMLVESRRVLAPGGLLLIETPNGDNVRVGASTFHLDPTHRHPIPAPLLRSFVEFAGFDVMATLELQPDSEMQARAERERWPDTLTRLLAGPRDVGLVARKPSAETREAASDT